MIHPWHDISNANQPDGIVSALVEIPKGSKVKYELDKETGLLKLDRVLFSSVMYPANYGFIPQTMDGDGDPLDILILCSEKIEPMCLVNAKIIGVMYMLDQGEQDRKIIAVAYNDISVNYINDINELPPHTMLEMKRFFLDYKTLENKKVHIEEFGNRHQALEVVSECAQIYKTRFPEK